jgi:hypothetical protein
MNEPHDSLRPRSIRLKKLRSLALALAAALACLQLEVAARAATAPPPTPEPPNQNELLLKLVQIQKGSAREIGELQRDKLYTDRLRKLIECEENLKTEIERDKYQKALTNASGGVPNPGKAGKLGVAPNGGLPATPSGALPFVDGTQLQLSFQFIDPFTDLIADGSSIASVLYEVYLGGSDEPTVLGISHDAQTSFSLAYTVMGFEPIIAARPLDALGAFIWIDGIHSSDNGAIGSAMVIQGCDSCVPDTGSTASLMGLGLLAAGLCRKVMGAV